MKGLRLGPPCLRPSGPASIPPCPRRAWRRSDRVQASRRHPTASLGTTRDTPCIGGCTRHFDRCLLTPRLSNEEAARQSSVTRISIPDIGAAYLSKHARRAQTTQKENLGEVFRHGRPYKDLCPTTRPGRPAS